VDSRGCARDLCLERVEQWHPADTRRCPPLTALTAGPRNSNVSPSDHRRQGANAPSSTCAKPDPSNGATKIITSLPGQRIGRHLQTSSRRANVKLRHEGDAGLVLEPVADLPDSAGHPRVVDVVDDQQHAGRRQPGTETSASPGPNSCPRTCPRPRSVTWPAWTRPSRNSRRSRTSCRTPGRYQALGAKISQGRAALTARPGTGKTLLARAVAGEAGVPFLLDLRFGLRGDVSSVSVPPRVREPVRAGQAELAVHHLSWTRSTRSAASVAPASAAGTTSASRPSTKLLVEMDGFDARGGIILIAGRPNRPDILDPALLRPGRFGPADPGVPPPDMAAGPSGDPGRALQGQAAGRPTADLDGLAKRHGRHVRRRPGQRDQRGPRLADRPARAGQRDQTAPSLEESVDRVIGGPGAQEPDHLREGEEDHRLPRGRAMALAAWAMPDLEPVYKLTILPRGTDRWPRPCRPRGRQGTDDPARR